MAEMTFVQGDTWPAITAALQRPSEALGAAATSVKFQFRKQGERTYTVNATAEIVSQDANTINVKYQWGASDLNVPGDYDAQWEVTFAGGYIETSDPPNWVEVRRQ